VYPISGTDRRWRDPAATHWRAEIGALGGLDKLALGSFNLPDDAARRRNFQQRHRNPMGKRAQRPARSDAGRRCAAQARAWDREARFRRIPFQANGACKSFLFLARCVLTFVFYRTVRLRTGRSSPI
jgi:hypothetical protein